MLRRLVAALAALWGFVLFGLAPPAAGAEQAVRVGLLKFGTAAGRTGSWR